MSLPRGQSLDEHKEDDKADEAEKELLETHLNPLLIGLNGKADSEVGSISDEFQVFPRSPDKPFGQRIMRDDDSSRRYPVIGPFE